MANNCYYNMKIRGDNIAISKLMEMFRWEGKYENDGLGRVFSADVYEHCSGYSCISGDCAWSVYSAMINIDGRNLLNVSKRLGLALEIYSSECGFCFQEHYLICNGEMLIDDEVGYYVYWVEGIETHERKELADNLGISVEKLVNGVNENGDYIVGGYKNFGDFTKVDSLPAPHLQGILAPGA